MSDKIKTFINFFIIVIPVIDPAGVFFNFPYFYFSLAVIVNFPDFNGKHLYFCLLFLAVYFSSAAYMEISPPPLGVDTLIKNGNLAKQVLYLPLLCFLTKDKNIIKYFIIATFVIAFVEIIVFYLYVYSPVSYPIWYYFHFQANDTIMLGYRTIFGFSLASVYHKSSALLIIVAAYNITNILYHHNKKKNFLGLLIIGITFFCGSTRACMLSFLLLCFFGYCYFLLLKKKWVLFSFICSVSIMFFVVLFFKILLDSEEASFSIKAGHLKGIEEQIFSSPLRSLFVGFGPGSLFYSYGTNNLRSITELTYWDMFRQYGILNGLFMILAFLFPVFSCFWGGKKYKRKRFVFGISFLLYYFIAGTNPLLFSSTGFLALLMMIVITDNINHRN